MRTLFEHDFIYNTGASSGMALITNIIIMSMKTLSNNTNRLKQTVVNEALSKSGRSGSTKQHTLETLQGMN